MDTCFNSAITKLATGQMLRIDNASGQSIAVLQGMVWITQAGDRRDVFLSDGEDFAFHRPGVALVEAISATRLLASARLVRVEKTSLTDSSRTRVTGPSTHFAEVGA